MNTLVHNISAMNAQRMNGLCLGERVKNMEKLSSGFKINRAADDASGLAISEKMRKQIRGLTQASSNAQDGISMVQVVDGALEEVHDMLQRGNELMVKAANGTLSESDREEINKEVQQLKGAIDQVAANTKFNETRLFPPEGLGPETNFMTSSNTYSLSFFTGGTNVVHDSQIIGIQGIGGVKAGNLLADRIAAVYVPNAANQIFDQFSSLKDAIDSTYLNGDEDKLKMGLDITYVDGPGKKLAYVTGSFYTLSQTLAGLSMTVDCEDFTEEDIRRGNGSALGKLESTIAHEMMHAVMDAAMPSRMYGNGGAEDFPLWFKEGTAQLTGGGYTTGWNDELMQIVKNGGTDDEIKEYLKKYTVEDRVYGHGYLAAAYMGYLAGGGTVDAIAGGMNNIFQQLINDPAKSLDEVFKGLTRKSCQDIINDINNGTDGGVAFVRELTEAAMDGAGSVIAADGLGAKATDVLGNTRYISEDYEKLLKESLKQKPVKDYLCSIHAGADSTPANKIHLKLFRMSSSDLGLSEVGMPRLSQEDARRSIDRFAEAIKLVSGVRSYYGAAQNRMEHTIRNLENVIENTTNAESRIRDTDMAAEMVALSLNNILLQAGQSVLSQANQSNEGMLSIL